MLNDKTQIVQAKGQSIRYNKWRSFNRFFSNGNLEVRYIREVIFGKRRDIRYWQVTTDTEKLPENSTWFLMTHVPGIKYSEVGKTGVIHFLFT